MMGKPLEDFSTGWTFVGTGSEEALGGTVPWFTGLTRLVADDDSYVVGDYLNPSSVGYALKGTNLGFSIPAGAIIRGIEVRHRSLKGGTGTISTTRVSIIKGGTVGSYNDEAGTFLGTTETLYTHGSSTELWGETWSPSDINASDFGFACQHTGTGADNVWARVDSYEINVHYQA
jgi:hypothetical protein